MRSIASVNTSARFVCCCFSKLCSWWKAPSGLNSNKSWPKSSSTAGSNSSKGGDAGKLIPVNLQAAVTEIGTLELRCLEKGGAGRWKLELNVRMKE